MTYEQTIAFLYSQLPMFTRIGSAAYKKDLHNTIVLLDHLGNPQDKFKSIHIAGTNGKGSTSHMLASILHTNGYKTGLYTSPHLNDFRVRIKVSDAATGLLEMISQDFVVDFTSKMQMLIKSIQPRFFELTVAMAFQYFAEEKIDVAIIETGLGGRLDSTNVINPELSIITNIGWDHMNILGNSLEEIAFEKAGIIKKNTPVIIGETLPGTKPVFAQKATLEHAPILYAEEIEIRHVHPEVEQLEIEVNYEGIFEKYATDLPVIYQQYNLRTVIAAIEELRKKGWRLTDEKNRHALLNVKVLTGLHGRWEIIRKDPLLVMDVGHNEDGVKQVLKQVDTMRHKVKAIHFITGMVKDKEIEKVLRLLPKDFKYYFTNAHIPRALPADELQAKAASFGLNGNCFEHVNDAIENALFHAGKNDLVLVCGSVFLAGEVNTEKWQFTGRAR
jgi:dihydrofolate synthase/folylpolyglutamate synthase